MVLDPLYAEQKHKVQYYWNQIRDWLLQHPNEIVILWLSEQLNPRVTGNEQYLGVAIENQASLVESIQ